MFATELRAVKWFDWLQVCDDGMVIALSDGNGQPGRGAVSIMAWSLLCQMVMGSREEER